MAFTPKYEPQPYVFKRLGPMTGSDRVYMEREIRELGQIVNVLVNSVKELQAYVKTL